MNWDNLFTEKDMSVLVRDKYRRPPITLRNCVLSNEAVPSLSFKVMLVDSGVEISLAPNIFVFECSSYIYLRWERKRPDFVGITSMPMK